MGAEAGATVWFMVVLGRGTISGEFAAGHLPAPPIGGDITPEDVRNQKTGPRVERNLA